MSSSTAGLVGGILLAEPISELLFSTTDRASVVRAAFVVIWAQMNYEQLTAVFRVEERSGQFVVASLINVLLTVGATVLLVVVLEQGATGVLLGNAAGTLVVWTALVVYRREQLGLQFSPKLFRAMERFGLPLVPSGLFMWVTTFSNRIFLVKLADVAEVGLFSLGARIASAITLLFVAFRAAWPAFAYSIEDDRRASRTYAFVLTYLLFIASWIALGLGVLAPWLVRLLATPAFYEAADVVAPLAFAQAIYAGYLVVVIGVGRARQTRFNWVVTGAGALVNVVLCLLLIPPFGMFGAAAASIAAFAVMFAGMTWRAQHLFPVPYQWRRVATIGTVAVGLTVLADVLDPPLAGAIALVLAFPLLLLPLGFYLPAERARIAHAAARVAPGRN